MCDFQLFARLMEDETCAVTDDGQVRIEAEDNGCFAVYFSEALLRTIENLPAISAPLSPEPIRPDQDDHPHS